MIDSGATNNFMSDQQCLELGLNVNRCNNCANVRLADGKVLKVSGSVRAIVDFGVFQTSLQFEVVNAEIPAILGIPFLQQVNPVIDWQKKSLFVNFGTSRKVSIQLKVFGKSQGKQVHFGETVILKKDDVATHSFFSENSFANLKIDNCNAVDCTSEQANVGILGSTTAFDNMVSDRPLGGAGSQQFVGNSSNEQCIEKLITPVSKQNIFSMQKPKQSSNTPCVTSNLSPKSKQSEISRCGQNENLELCSLRQFMRGEKKQQYKQQFLILVTKSDLELNFTHRSSYGTQGEGDLHGSYTDLAKNTLKTLQNSFPEVFKEPTYPVQRSTNLDKIFQHAIKLVDEQKPPPKRKLYPLDQDELVELKKQIDDLLSDNRIEISSSPYGAPILFARKKNGKLRMCIDYRQLNSNTILDAYPLPRIDDLTSRLNGATVFSKIDLNNAYHQIPVDPNDQFKTAFTCRYGTYQFKVMPFGLCNAPSTFQRVMNTVFFKLLDKGVVIYLDDILVYSKSVEEHQRLLNEVFSLLNQYKLYVKAEKCALFLESVEFLGHTISGKGLHVEQGKVTAVQDWPEPANITQVQSFLGLCNYYRKFILRFSEIAAPLTLLTRKNVNFEFGSEQKRAFGLLKTCLADAPVLKLFDFDLETRIICDASAYCVGSILEQRHNDGWHPVEFYSKRLSSAERNYSATEREFVAIKQSLERWRHFLIGKHFVVLSDHAALQYLTTQSQLKRRQSRWLDFFQEFAMEIQHVPGKNNVADYLSRIPGMDSLDLHLLCSNTYTLNMCNLCDFIDATGAKSADINSIITLFDKSSFLQSIKKSQIACTQEWFLSKLQLAQRGDRVFQVRDDILCKLVEDVFCPVIPSSDSELISVICSDAHSSALGGHLGERKMLQFIQKRFYWLNMSKDVSKFCKECVVCQSSKSSTQKQSGMLQPVQNPSKPFDVVTMDFVGPFPKSSRGFDMVFTVVDRFSRLCCFVPMVSTASASDVAQLFFENWICRYGVPSKIISDRDSKFTSQFWQSLLKVLQCKLALSTAYHPQTDGLSERYHRTVLQVLRSYVGVDQSNWCKYIKQAEFAINNTMSTGTQFTPFNIIYGQQPSMPLDLAIRDVQHVNVQAVEQLIAKRHDIHNKVVENLAHSQSQMIQSANKRRRPVTYSVGDLVWLKTENLQLPSSLTRKLAPRWVGPFPIVQVITDTAMKLQLPDHWRLHPTFHVSLLKPHMGPARPDQAPVFTTDGHSDEYEVQAILSHRIGARDRVQYLVRWKGFDASEDMWLPEPELGGAQRLVKAYKRRHGLA